jgi:hypothetical protein
MRKRINCASPSFVRGSCAPLAKRRGSGQNVQSELDFGLCLNVAILRSRCQNSMSWPYTTLPADGKSKSKVLREAGISTSAANRHEHFNALPAEEKEQRIARGRAAIGRGCPGSCGRRPGARIAGDRCRSRVLRT